MVCAVLVDHYKVSALNSLYSTQLYSRIFSVAQHIIELNIDEKILAGNLDIVNEIAETQLENGTTFRCYSFATKYCSFHRPDIYPIYDSYVDIALKYFNNREKFTGLDAINCKDYRSFVGIIKSFQTYYHLEKYTLKQIDKYLWQVGYDLKQGDVKSYEGFKENT